MRKNYKTQNRKAERIGFSLNSSCFSAVTLYYTIYVLQKSYVQQLPGKSRGDFPGVDTAYSLFIKKQGVSHSCHSFCFTQWILLSTIRQADGFETTDCLECLQILDILIYSRRVCFRICSSREENVLHTSVNQLLYSCRHQSSAYIFSSLLSFMYPLHVLLIYYAFPYPNKEESIRMTDI